MPLPAVRLLLAVQTAPQIRDAFKIEMPVLQLLQAETIGQVAASLRAPGATLSHT